MDLSTYANPAYGTKKRLSRAHESFFPKNSWYPEGNLCVKKRFAKSLLEGGSTYWNFGGLFTGRGACGGVNEQLPKDHQQKGAVEKGFVREKRGNFAGRPPGMPYQRGKGAARRRPAGTSGRAGEGEVVLGTACLEKRTFLMLPEGDETGPSTKTGASILTARGGKAIPLHVVRKQLPDMTWEWNYCCRLKQQT